VIIFILVLGAWLVGATVPGDIAAGLPMERVIANGLGAGPRIWLAAFRAGFAPPDHFSTGSHQPYGWLNNRLVWPGL
jgi:hypothetical protein